MNIVFEHSSATATKVTVNAQYVVVRSVVATGVGTGDPECPRNQESVAFGSGQQATFPSGSVTCIANFKWEQDILELIAAKPDSGGG